MSSSEIMAIEVGSTLTKVSWFCGEQKYAGAMALTTPRQVMEGVAQALANLEAASGKSIQDKPQVFALSSAAGGLRMTVHGLTREMTAKAAEEAVLGAGGNISLLTAGALSPRDLKRIEAARPNLIMLAGGVEYGEEETVYHNAQLIAGLSLTVPVVYAGNVTLQDEIRRLFHDQDKELYLVDNVYPGFDQLNIKPVRRVIQQIFSERLTLAPGIDELRQLANGHIMPVPAACLRAAEVLAETVGDLVVVDIGGATTDVHSIVTQATEDNLEIQVPSRRTVEGDLGLFVSADSVWQKLGGEGSPTPLKAVPETDAEKHMSQRLAAKATEEALIRHAGKIVHGAYLSGGKIAVRGQDLRNVKLVVGTGGGLVGLENGVENLRTAIRHHRRNSLLPGDDVRICLDRNYVFSACGSFAELYPKRATAIMYESIGKKES